MKKWVLDLLRCPGCGADLVATPLEVNSAGEVWMGILDCANDSCRAWFPVIRGVPRLLDESLRAEETLQFVREYKVDRNCLGGNHTAPSSGLKAKTVRNFGYEWTKYDRFGWDDPVYNIESEEVRFCAKSLLEPEEFHEKLVLDAGCGNGRYSYLAAKYGARVVGIDLGHGVEAAAKNTAECPDIQIVQADIFRAPFPESCFDIVFSVGVLMHTGDARGATASLATKVKPGGMMSVRLYGKGNPIYEWVDEWLRKRTTKMTIPQLEEFTRKVYAFRRFLDRVGGAALFTRFMRLDPHPHCVFDWYAAPIATHHTHSEVEVWLRESRFEVVRSDRHRYNFRSPARAWLHAKVGSPEAVTVLAARETSCVE